MDEIDNQVAVNTIIAQRNEALNEVARLTGIIAALRKKLDEQAPPEKTE